MIAKTFYFNSVNNSTKYSKWLIALLIILQKLIDSASMTIMYIELNSNENDILLRGNFLIIQIIFNGLISVLVLKHRLYKHHYMSIVLLSIGFILVSFLYFTLISSAMTSLYYHMLYSLGYSGN